MTVLRVLGVGKRLFMLLETSKGCFSCWKHFHLLISTFFFFRPLRHAIDESIINDDLLKFLFNLMAVLTVLAVGKRLFLLEETLK